MATALGKLPLSRGETTRRRNLANQIGVFLLRILKTTPEGKQQLDLGRAEKEVAMGMAAAAVAGQ